MAFTFFFRDITTIEEAVQQILPTIIGRSKVYIWDAGCAMGPEPYTLAIVLAENLGSFAFKNVKIFATDHDESGHFGEIIAKGIASEIATPRLPGQSGSSARIARPALVSWLGEGMTEPFHKFIIDFLYGFC